MKCLILAGGMGKRLRPITETRPKTMIEIAGLPIIHRQLTWLKGRGFDQVVISLGYMKEKVMDYIGDGSKFGLRVKYSVEDNPLGTAGGIKNAKFQILKREEEEEMESATSFLMLYGDLLTNLDPSRLVLAQRESRACLAALAVIPLRSPFGIIELRRGKDSSRVSGFKEKPVIEDYWMNAGVYCLSSKIFSRLPDSGSFESLVLPKLASDNRLRAVKFGGAMWRSIDSIKDIDEAEEEYKKGSIVPRAVISKN